MSKKRNGKWTLAEPGTVWPGRTVRFMLAGRNADGSYRHATGKVTKLLKGGAGVEIRHNGGLITRDTQDVAVTPTAMMRGQRTLSKSYMKHLNDTIAASRKRS